MARVTVAFASTTHARAALKFLAQALELRSSAVSGGEGSAMAQVDIEVAAEDVPRFRTLLAGVHGLVVAESAEVDSRIA